MSDRHEIEKEKERARKTLSRSLFLIGVGTLSIALYITINARPGHYGTLADITYNFQQEAPLPIPATSPTLPTGADNVTGTSSPATNTATGTNQTEASAIMPSNGDGQADDAIVNSGANVPSTQNGTPPDQPTSTAPLNAEPTSTAVTPPLPTSEFRDFPEVVPTTAKTLPYIENTFQPGDGWESWWGNFSEDGGILTVNAETSTTGGGVLLPGTSAWTDYTLTAKLDRIKGSSFGLLARYTSMDDYVACEFDLSSPNEVHMYLDQYTSGKGVTLASADASGYNQAINPDITASVSVKGAQGTCTFDGTPVAGTISEPPSGGVGGIGFTTWDPTANNSSIIIKAVEVSD